MKKLKTEKINNFDVEFYKDKHAGKSYVSGRILENNKIIYSFENKFSSKAEAYEFVRRTLYDREFTKPILDKINEQKREEREEGSRKYNDMKNELALIINNITSKYHFLFAYDGFFGKVQLDYMPQYVNYDNNRDKPQITVDLEKYEISSFSFAMPDGINYNGFGVQMFNKLDLNAIKYLSKEYALFYVNAKKVLAELKAKNINNVAESIRLKYYPRKN